MRDIRLSFLKAMIFNLAALGVGHALCPQSQVQEILRSAKRLFGDEVQGQPHLFELNQDYVLKLMFDDQGDISIAEITPKYFWEESKTEWKEPDRMVWLSDKDYREILSKVGNLKKLGALANKGTTGAVTNLKLWLLDQYEYAFVQRRVHRTADLAQSMPDLVHSFSVYFIHRVEGAVDDKQLVAQYGASEQPKLKISGRWYFTTKAEFDKAVIGKHASLNVAGPIN